MIGLVSLPFDILLRWIGSVFIGGNGDNWFLIIWSWHIADLLVFHLGEKNLPMISSAELTDLIVEDLHRISQMLPASLKAWVHQWHCHTEGWGCSQEEE